jgi:hypothetical protein
MAQRKKLEQAILAHGEHTGHFHEAHGEGVALYDDGVLEAPEGATVTHQEHGTVTVPPGTYQRSIVQEFDHFAEEARNVAD